MRICMVRHAHSLEDPRVLKEALALLARGHSVDIICLRGRARVRRCPYTGMTVFELPMRHKRLGICRYLFEYGLSFVTMSVLLSYLHVFKQYHCIQVNTMPDFLVFTTIIPRLFGAKILLDLHEPVPELWLAKRPAGGIQLLLIAQMFLQQLAIRYADQCITVTEALRRRLAKGGANIDKIVVVRNAPDDTAFYYDSNSTKHDFGGRFTLITHGTIEQRYGHELIVRAVCDLKEKLPDLQLEITGDGQYRKEIENLISELRCEEYVHLLGYIPTDQLMQRLRAADVGVVAMHLSPYSELIDTNKMYEYMALRKPIIISRLSPLAEVLDESCARFFEPGDYKDLARCVAELYHKPALRRQLAENAYRRYRQICWKASKDMYTNLVESLVRARKHYRS